MALSPLGNVVFCVKLDSHGGKRAVVNELQLPAALAPAALALRLGWPVAISLREAVAGSREWVWGTGVELGEGPRAPHLAGVSDLNSADRAAPRQEPGWRVGATAALSSSPSSRRR